MKYEYEGKFYDNKYELKGMTLYQDNIIDLHCNRMVMIPDEWKMVIIKHNENRKVVK